MTKARCIECNRIFDLLNELDAEEWHYGHDCEILNFDDLDDQLRNKLIYEAYESLCQENLVPYGIQTGDDGLWYEYDPAIELARKTYNDENNIRV